MRFLTLYYSACGWPQASAIGKNMTNAKTFLEKRYNNDIGIEDAIHTALLTLKEGFEGQVSGANIEVGVIGPDRKFKVLSEAEVRWDGRMDRMVALVVERHALHPKPDLSTQHLSSTQHLPNVHTHRCQTTCKR